MIFTLSRTVKTLLTRKLCFPVDLIPVCLSGLSWRRMLNWLLTETSVLVKPERPWGFPTLLQVEPSSRCNLRCPTCPAGTGMERPSGDMNLGLFNKIVDELGEYLLLILFWDWGEPFLNPAAYKMIEYARLHGIRVMASTNGQVFIGNGHARQAVISGLDVLVFSVDGITQETYGRYRKGGSLEAVVGGIRNVVREREILKSRTPVVNLRFVVMKHNEHEISALEDFPRSLEVDVLTIRRFHAVPLRRRPGGREREGLRPSRAEHALPSYETEEPVPAAKNPCRNLWNCPTVHWDGTLCTCYLDFEEERPLGNLGSQSFKEIWEGESYRRLRRSFRKNWREMPLCGKCSYSFQGGNIRQEATREAFFLSSGRLDR